MNREQTPLGHPVSIKPEAFKGSDLEPSDPRPSTEFLSKGFANLGGVLTIPKLGAVSICKCYRVESTYTLILRTSPQHE